MRWILKKFLLIYAITALFCSVGTACYAQNVVLPDSIVQILNALPEDTSKLNTLQGLYDRDMFDHPEYATLYAEQAVDISKNLNEKKWLAIWYNQLAHLWRIQGQFHKSIELYNASITLCSENNLDKVLAEALIGMGNTYWRKGDFINARKYFNQNLALCERINDQDGVASSYNNLGNIYSEEGDYKNAIENYIESSRIYLKLGEKSNYAITLANIGNVQNQLANYDKAIEYFKKSRAIAEEINNVMITTWLDKTLGLLYKNQEKYDDALLYFNKALAAYQQQNEKYEQGEIYRYLGNVYLNQEKYIQAEEQYHKSMGIKKEINDSLGISYVLNKLAWLYLSNADPVQATHVAMEARAIGEKLENPLVVMNALRNLSAAYESTGNYKKAYESRRQLETLKDSIFDEEKKHMTQELEVRYQTELKEQEIAKLNAENEVKALQLEKRDNERIYLVTITILVLLFGIVVWSRYRIKARSNKKLKELDHLKSRLFANVSHEFRTPLTLILGSIEDRIERAAEGQDKHELIVLRKNAQRLEELIEQMLDLAKLESGKLNLQVGKHEIRSFLNAVSSSFSSLSHRKKIQFNIVLPQQEQLVYFDEDILQKIINNLLSNAFKFTPEHGTVSLTTSLHIDFLEIEVRDNGPGIATENIPFIFDRFYQVDNLPTRTHEGFGIGLALTYELVYLHRGSITVKSTPGQETIFNVKIPVDKKHFNASEILLVSSPLEIKRLSNPNYETKDGAAPADISKTLEEQPIILVVEDNEDLMHYIGNHLTGYKLLYAKDGKEGLDRASKHIPDLVICDVMMPRMDGVQLCKALKTKLETSHIPIILLTAKADIDSKLKGLETGADDYITKPFHSSELLTRVANLISQRRLLRQHFSKRVILHPKELAITPPDEVFLQKVMDIVERNISNSGFNINDFQHEIGMSRMQLHRKLKALTDQSASEFIRNQRLKRASQLLAKSDLSVSEVCYSVGFNNLSYFTKCFKEQYKSTPSDYSTDNR